MMLTAKRAADRLGISRSLVYDLVTKGRLPAVRIGNGRGTIRIDEADLEKYIEGAQIERPLIHELKHLTVAE